MRHEDRIKRFNSGRIFRTPRVVVVRACITRPFLNEFVSFSPPLKQKPRLGRRLITVSVVHVSTGNGNNGISWVWANGRWCEDTSAVYSAYILRVPRASRHRRRRLLRLACKTVHGIWYVCAADTTQKGQRGRPLSSWFLQGHCSRRVRLCVCECVVYVCVCVSAWMCVLAGT